MCHILKFKIFGSHAHAKRLPRFAFGFVLILKHLRLKEVIAQRDDFFSEITEKIEALFLKKGFYSQI